ncbi:MAG TPA: PKD domain-containing protein, partial [Chryseosolibacter sp.]
MCDSSGNLVRIFLFCLVAANGLTAQAQHPVAFIENKNQWPDDIDYVSGIPGGNMVVGPASFKYVFLDYDKLQELHDQSHLRHAEDEQPDHVDGHAVFVSFPGANKTTTPHPFGRSTAYYNYYLGNDPAHWASEAYAYEGMVYESVYPGVDLKVYAAGENVKYDWVVAPGSDPSAISISYAGADQISLANGNLTIRTPLADVVERRPFAYQVIGGKKMGIACDYRLDGHLVSFSFPDGFDPCYELVIDPLLIFSTYSGSTADNWGSTATPGEHGDLYSAGVTNESKGGKFPATAGAFQTTSGGLYDIGILKYDSLGTHLLFATYLGGSDSESPHSLIMNPDGDLIVLGTTSSANFPTTF